MKKLAALLVSALGGAGILLMLALANPELVTRLLASRAGEKPAAPKLQASGSGVGTTTSLNEPKVQATASSPAIVRPGCKVYNYSGGRYEFGFKPISGVANGVAFRTPGSTEYVPEVMWAYVYAAAINDCPLVLDEMPFTFDQWLKVVRSIRETRNYPDNIGNQIRVSQWNMPGTPFSNVIFAGPGNLHYDGWLKVLDQYARHPLSAEAWALMPSLGRDQWTTSIDEWNRCVDVVLPQYRILAGRTRQPIVPCLYVCTAEGDVATYETMRAMCGRMEREGLDFAVWIPDRQPAYADAIQAIRDFERGVSKPGRGAPATSPTLVPTTQRLPAILR